MPFFGEMCLFFFNLEDETCAYVRWIGVLFLLNCGRFLYLKKCDKCVDFINLEAEIFENKEVCRFWWNVSIFFKLEVEILKRKKCAVVGEMCRFLFILRSIIFLKRKMCAVFGEMCWFFQIRSGNFEKKEMCRFWRIVLIFSTLKQKFLEKKDLCRFWWNVMISPS